MSACPVTRRTLVAGGLASLAGLAACERAAPPGPAALYVLFDASKTYSTTENKRAALDATMAAVRALRGGDRFAFVKVGECSFGRENVMVSGDVPRREDLAARAKLALIDDVDGLSRRLRRENFTDITGALWEVHRLASEGLHEARVIVLFSDLEEDVARSACAEGRESFPDLGGAHVILAGVTDLQSDLEDPMQYFARVEAFRAKLAAAGAGEVVTVDGAPQRLRTAVEGLIAPGR